MRRGIVIVAFSAAAIFAAPVRGASLQDQIRDCSRIEDSVKRLACFDGLATTTAPKAAAVSTTADVGKWRVVLSVSKIDDSPTVILSLQSDDQIAGRFGGQTYLSLLIRCMEQKTDVLVHFGGHFMSSIEGGGLITYRIDRRPAQTASFSESTNHEALFAPQPIAFVKSLLEAKQLVIRAQPFSESDITAQFTVAGTR